MSFPIVKFLNIESQILCLMISDFAFCQNGKRD